MTLKPYGMIINPKAKLWNSSHREGTLKEIERFFGNDCIIDGLETKSQKELQEYIRKLEEQARVLIIAGGDGTINDVINTVDPSKELAVFPCGSGNAVGHSLKLPKNIYDVLGCILLGSAHPVDVVSDGETKGFIMSFGMEGLVLQERNNSDLTGIWSYIVPLANTVRRYKRKTVTLTLDEGTSNERIYEYPNTLSVIATTIPFYGYGFQMVPEARVDDVKLHIRVINSPTHSIARAFLEGKPLGEHHECLEARIQSEESSFQIDGDPKGLRDEVNLRLLSGSNRANFRCYLQNEV